MFRRTGDQPPLPEHRTCSSVHPRPPRGTSRHEAAVLPPAMFPMPSASPTFLLSGSDRPQRPAPPDPQALLADVHASRSWEKMTALLGACIERSQCLTRAPCHVAFAKAQLHPARSRIPKAELASAPTRPRAHGEPQPAQLLFALCSAMSAALQFDALIC